MSMASTSGAGSAPFFVAPLPRMRLVFEAFVLIGDAALRSARVVVPVSKRLIAAATSSMWLYSSAAMFVTRFVKWSELSASAKVERLERIVHDRRHLAKFSAHQFLDSGGGVGIRRCRLRQLGRKFVESVNHVTKPTLPPHGPVFIFKNTELLRAEACLIQNTGAG